MASWNVRTLLDVEGSMEIAKQSYDTGLIADERKNNQVVKSYQVSMAAIQETKWLDVQIWVC